MIRERSLGLVYSGRRPGRFAGGIVVRALTIWLFISAALATAQPWREPHQRAIAAYRGGDARGALAQLQALLAQPEVGEEVRWDAVVVAAATGDYSLAVSLAKDIALANAPNYLLEALGKAARLARDYARSREAYGELLRRDRTNVEGVVGKALALLGEDKAALARDELNAVDRSVVVNSAHALAYFEAQALVAQRLGADVEVFRWANEMLRLDPQSVAASRMQFTAATRLGLPHVAAELLDKAGVSDEERARNQRDRLIFESRFEYPGETASEFRFRLDNVISELRTFAQIHRGTDEGTRALWDIVALLNIRGHQAAALETLTPLLVGNPTFPIWFQSVIGQVLLANRRPVESLPWFEKAIAAGANDYSTRISYFYALLEAERIDDALNFAEKIRADAELAVRNHRGDRNAVLSAEILRANALFFTDQVDAAWALVEQLRAEVPANPEVLDLYVNLLAARGYPRLALEQVEMSLAESPSSVRLLTQKSNLQRQIGDRLRSRATLAYAQALDPESRDVQRALRARARDDAAVLRFDWGWGRSQAEAVPAVGGTRERAAVWAGYSPWLSDRWRLLGQVALRTDRPPGANTIERRSASLGAQWRGRDVDAVLSSQADTDGPNRRTGFTLRLDYELSDELGLTMSAGRNDSRLPLRAWNVGTEMTYAGLEGRWRAHPNHQLGVAALGARFTDANRRSEIYAWWTARWHSHAHTKFESRVEAYATENTRNDVPYFSPLRRYGVLASATAEWIQWRRYDASFSHVLHAILGRDWQRDTPATDVVGVRYGHVWGINACTRVHYNAEWLRRGYDGRPESKRAVSFAVEVRLP